MYISAQGLCKVICLQTDFELQLIVLCFPLKNTEKIQKCKVEKTKNLENSKSDDFSWNIRIFGKQKSSKIAPKARKKVVKFSPSRQNPEFDP